MLLVSFIFLWHCSLCDFNFFIFIISLVYILEWEVISLSLNFIGVIYPSRLCMLFVIKFLNFSATLLVLPLKSLYVA